MMAEESLISLRSMYVRAYRPRALDEVAMIAAGTARYAARPCSLLSRQV
jgi:hypothetical protein